MKTSMIINRIEDWFDQTDSELDECYIAIKMLKALSTRTKIGLDYDRFLLSTLLYSRCSEESIMIVDKAIVVLLSRNLVRFEPKKHGNRKLIITDIGQEALKLYEEELKNENKRD